MIPAISSMTGLRSKVERNRMMPMIREAPAKAPRMTERKPESVNAPALKVPPPASMTNATPKLAPELIPRIDASARGLLKTVWSIRPDADSAAPQSAAVMHCGRRDSQIMKLQLDFSTSWPSRMSATASAGIWTEPNIRLAVISKRIRATRTVM